MPPIAPQIPILLTVECLALAVRDDLSDPLRAVLPAETIVYGSAAKARQSPTPPRVVFELDEQFDIQTPGPSTPQANFPGMSFDYTDPDTGQRTKARALMHTVDRALVTVHHPGPAKHDSLTNRTLARAECVKLRAAVLAAIYRATHGSFAFFGGRWLDAEKDYRTGAACEFVVGVGCPVLDDPKLATYDATIKANMIARFPDLDYLVAEAVTPPPVGP